MEVKYDIFLQSGELYESVRISGQDEEDCQEQLNLYLTTKQNCYGQESEEDSLIEQSRRAARYSPEKEG